MDSDFIPYNEMSWAYEDNTEHSDGIQLKYRIINIKALNKFAFLR